jgi:hypothetical protein
MRSWIDFSGDGIGNNGEIINIKPVCFAPRFGFGVVAMRPTVAICAEGYHAQIIAGPVVVFDVVGFAWAVAQAANARQGFHCHHVRNGGFAAC